MTGQITIGEVLELMRKNGFEWTTNDFWDGSGASCAMGQVVRNLNGEASANEIARVGYHLSDSMATIAYKAGRANTSIIGFNDGHASSLQDVIDWATETYKGLEDRVLNY